MIILRRSKKGVPHIIVDIGKEKFSICYFGKSNLYRVFKYDGIENTKVGDIPLDKGQEVNFGEWISKNYKSN